MASMKRGDHAPMDTDDELHGWATDTLDAFRRYLHTEIERGGGASVHCWPSSAATATRPLTTCWTT